MTSRDFCFWMQGFVELYGNSPTSSQWDIIKRHLALVFKHEIDPSMPDPDGKLQDVHEGKLEEVPLTTPPWSQDTMYRC